MNEKKNILIQPIKFFWIKAIEIIVLTLIILVPLVFYPYCITVFLPVKEAIAEILIVIGLMLWGLKIVSEEKFSFAHSSVNLPILSFMTICVLSLLWSNSQFVSLKELPLFLIGPCLYFVITNNIRDERQINRIISVLLIIGSLFGIYGIFQYLGIDFSFWIRNIGRQQVFGLFGNVNYFAEYLIIPLPIAVALFFASHNKTKKIFLLVGILAMGGTLIVTFTRGSYLGLGVSLIFIFLLFLISRGRVFIKGNKKIFILILIAIILITFLMVIPNPLNKTGTAIFKIKSRISIAQLSTEFSFGRRMATWKFTGMMIKDHPLLGSGIGTFKYNSLSYQAKFFDQGENRSLYPYGFAYHSHNEYLQLWAEMGIIGLGIFIWLIITYFSYGLKVLKRTKKNDYKQGIIIGLMGSVTAVLVDGLFGFPLHLPASIVLFWLVLGLTVAEDETEIDNQPIKASQENFNEEEKREKKSKGKKNRIDEIDEAEDNKNNPSRWKTVLSIGIILLSVFLMVTLIRPFTARIYWYYGYREVESKNWNKAIKNFEEALKWDPYLGQVYYDIGKILQKKEFYGLAQEYLEKASKYVDHPDLPQDLAFIYLKKGLLDKAVIKLKEAISYQRNEKSMVLLYSELGNTYVRIRRDKPAEIAFKNALKIDSNFANAHYGLAGVYARQNRLQEALEEFQNVIALAPDSKEARYSKILIQKITQALMNTEQEEIKHNKDD